MQISNMYAGSVPMTGNCGSRKIKSTSALVKKESLDSEGLTFKDIAVIAKNLELQIISECQYKNNEAEGKSWLQVPAMRKVDNDTLALTISRSNQSLGSNGSRYKTLGKTRSSDINADDIHTSALESSLNGTSNGLTVTAALVKQKSMDSLPEGRTGDCNAADKGKPEEMDVNSTVSP